MSRVLGVIWASDPTREGVVEEAFGRGLVEYARASNQPTAVALLRMLAVLGTIATAAGPGVCSVGRSACARAHHQGEISSNYSFHSDNALFF